jgi:integral membrane sensor domain MASE1
MTTKISNRQVLEKRFANGLRTKSTLTIKGELAIGTVSHIVSISSAVSGRDLRRRSKPLVPASRILAFVYLPFGIWSMWQSVKELRRRNEEPIELDQATQEVSGDLLARSLGANIGSSLTTAAFMIKNRHDSTPVGWIINGASLTLATANAGRSGFALIAKEREKS